MPAVNNLYPYRRSSKDRYVLSRNARDGGEYFFVLRGSEQDMWAYIHRNHSFSVDHAFRYEGYKAEPEIT